MMRCAVQEEEIIEVKESRVLDREVSDLKNEILMKDQISVLELAQRHLLDSTLLAYTHAQT